MNSFDRAFELVIGAEGGYVNDPQDPGGETKYGISKRAYPALDIRALTPEAAKAIYRRDYWDPCRCDDLPEIVACALFDAAVNQGVKTAIKLLQRAVGVSDDGILGAATLAAVRKAGRQAPALLMAERALRYTDTANFRRFGRGWMRRLFHLAYAR